METSRPIALFFLPQCGRANKVYHMTGGSLGRHITASHSGQAGVSRKKITTPQGDVVSSKDDMDQQCLQRLNQFALILTGVNYSGVLCRPTVRNDLC